MAAVDLRTVQPVATPLLSRLHKTGLAGMDDPTRSLVCYSYLANPTVFKPVKSLRSVEMRRITLCRHGSILGQITKNP